MAIKDVQKTHTQHAVPQNIMDVEFKLKLEDESTYKLSAISKNTFNLKII